MIKAVLFDVGGVLIEEPSEKRYEEYGNLHSESSGNIKKKLRSITYLFGTGKIPSERFWTEASKKLRIEKKLFRKIWIEAVENSKEKAEVFKLARRLKSNGYKIGILSDTSIIDARIISKRDVYSIFHPNIFLSFKIGYEKPSKKIFRFALKKLKLKPNEVAFMDNRKNHAESARKLGIFGIHFTSYKKLVHDFKKLGVL